MSDFETWWQQEGQEFLYALNTTTDDDIKLVAEIAWKNGAYCAEQAEQEPVGVVTKESLDGVVKWNGWIPREGTKLYAAPVEPVKQEPVAWMDLHKELGKLRWMGGDEGWDNAINAVRDRLIELATPHPVRTKDLTDEEIDRALDAANVPELPAGYESVELEIARAVIAADREKNGITSDGR